MLVLFVTFHMIHKKKGNRQLTYWSATEQFHMPYIE